MKYFSLLYFVHAVRGWINQTSEDRGNNASSWCPLYYLQRLSKKNHCSSFCKWILPNTMCQSPSMAFYHKPRSSEYLARMMIHCNKNY